MTGCSHQEAIEESWINCQSMKISTAKNNNNIAHISFSNSQQDNGEVDSPNAAINSGYLPHSGRPFTLHPPFPNSVSPRCLRVDELFCSRWSAASHLCCLCGAVICLQAGFVGLPVWGQAWGALMMEIVLSAVVSPSFSQDNLFWGHKRQNACVFIFDVQIYDRLYVQSSFSSSTCIFLHLHLRETLCSKGICLQMMFRVHERRGHRRDIHISAELFLLLHSSSRKYSGGWSDDTRCS